MDIVRGIPRKRHQPLLLSRRFLPRSSRPSPLELRLASSARFACSRNRMAFLSRPESALISSPSRSVSLSRRPRWSSSRFDISGDIPTSHIKTKRALKPFLDPRPRKHPGGQTANLLVAVMSTRNLKPLSTSKLKYFYRAEHGCNLESAPEAMRDSFSPSIRTCVPPSPWSEKCSSTVHARWPSVTRLSTS